MQNILSKILTQILPDAKYKKQTKTMMQSINTTVKAMMQSIKTD